MARKNLSGLPQYCERLPSGKIRYKPPGGESHTFDLRKNASPAEIQTYYGELVTANSPRSLKYLWTHYCKTRGFQSKSPRTKKDYTNYYESLVKTFGSSDMGKVTLAQFSSWQEERAYGVNGAPSQCNKETKLLRLVMRAAKSQDLLGPSYTINWSSKGSDLQMVEVPDDTKIEPNKKLMTVNMFLLIRSHCSKEMKVAATIAYLTGLRQGDIIALRKDEVLPSGAIELTQNKTRVLIQKSVTAALEDAVHAAYCLEGHKKNPECEFLIPTRKGTQYTSDGFRSNWDRARRKAYPHTNGAPVGYRTRFHDLRHRGTSDIELEDGAVKADFTGHTGEGRDRMAALYDEASRLPIQSPTLNVDLPLLKEHNR
jgi:integrase